MTPTYPTPDAIRAARLALGLTQTQAGAVIYASLRAWQDYESGARRLHPGLWELWQAKLGLIRLPRHKQAA
jgi:hypothetical protein